MATIKAGACVCDVEGDGFPVVMIHGLGGTSNSYQPQMKALEGYKVIRIDLPGAGRSAVPLSALSIGYLATEIVNAINELGVTCAHFVGHSMGTIMCQQIALENSALVASLTLFGAIIEPPEAARAGLKARAEAARHNGMSDIADQIIANTLSPLTRETKPEVLSFVRESVMRQDAEGYARTCEALSAAQAIDAKHIQTPTLLVTGDGDPVAPVAMAEQLAENLPNSELSIIKNCGHWATMENAGEVNTLLTKFLLKS
ncbi:alpha/beta fold hydrolase [Sneathiella sp. CAU 1612]|uniref:Alpha/beta fold hydrolase n=1 Tax=Sneathiella sedimenti TaxID=2816034 RepID=A0ABS3F6N9_9PROT|nr:alpha/beta fold hydrolase [Sneathiella sedimenti]MBO0334007.1 alpha/beta fold hydrolase [Sneathiella sedimenti]